MRVRFSWACLLLMVASCALAGEAESGGAGAGPVSLGNMQFVPPGEPWRLGGMDPKGTAALYVSPIGGETNMRIAFAGGMAPKKPEDGETMKQMIIDQLLANRRQSKVEILEKPHLVNDGRFFAIIAERFRKPAGEITQITYYRNLGGHQIVVTIGTLATDATELNEIRQTAMSICLSGQLIPRGTKAPPRPDAGIKAEAAGATAGGPAGGANSAEVATARKKLEEATAKVMEELGKRAFYQKKLKAAEEAEARLRQLKESQADRGAIAKASAEHMSARSDVELLRKEALEGDGAVMEARRELAEARGTK